MSKVNTLLFSLTMIFASSCGPAFDECERVSGPEGEVLIRMNHSQEQKDEAHFFNLNAETLKMYENMEENGFIVDDNILRVYGDMNRDSIYKIAGERAILGIIPSPKDMK